MKKLLATLCAAICALSLGSPASAADNRAYTLYQNAAAEFSSVGSIEVRGVCYTTSIVNGAGDAQQLSSFQMQRVNTADGVQMGHLGYKNGTLWETLYYKEGVYYRDRAGYPLKYKLREDEFLDGDSIHIHRDLIRLPQSLFQNAAVQAVEGGYLVTLNAGALDPFEMMSIESLAAAVRGGAPFATTVRFWFDDSGLLSRYQVKSAVTTDHLSGGASQFVVHMNITVEARNRLKAVEFPADLSSYPWVA